ncbi:MAG: hypothetical protein EBT61_18090 [Verrucomicrobia bacterium]|nr:hypothetical protein [Verrucomicrobiota bacterium]
MASEDLLFKLGVDAKGIERGLTGVSAQVKSFASETIGTFTKAFAVAAAVESIRELGAKMLELRRSAEKQGVGTTFLQTIEVLAVKFGGSAEDATSALDKLNVKIGEAREPGSAAAKAFEKFGIALEDSAGFARSTEDVFKDLATRYKELPDASAKAAMAFDIFGRSGKNVAEILALGGKALDEFGAKSNKVLSTDKVNALADAYQNVKSALSSVGGLFQSIAGAVAVTFEKTSKLAGALSAGLGFRDALKTAVAKPEDSEKIKVKVDTTAADAAIKASQDAWLDALAKVRASYADLVRQMAATSQAVYNARAVFAEAEQSRAVNALPEFSVARMAAQEKLDRMADEREMRDVDAARKAKESLEKEYQIALVKFQLETDTLKKKELELEADKKGMEVAKQEEAILQKKTHHLNAHVQRENAANEVLRRRREIEAASVNADRALADAKSARTKYTLEELATGNPRGVADPKLREEMIRAQEASRLEKRAEFGRSRLGESEETIQGFLDKAQSIKAGLTRLNDNERFPFKSLEESSQTAAKLLKAIKDNQEKEPKIGGP